MGVFKNGVGRPSNETIKKRNIFKGLCFILVVIIILLVAYIINNKLNTKENKQNYEKLENTTKFDISKIETKKNEDNSQFVDIYVYDKKINIEGCLGVNSIKTIDDIAIFLAVYPSVSKLIIVNTKADILYSGENEIEEYCDNKVSECMTYKVVDNKIRFYTDKLGQESSIVCNAKEDEVMVKEYELIYKNGTLSESKIIKEITAKQIINGENIKCESD